MEVVRVGRDLVQTLEMISAPCEDFVLLDAFAIRSLDVEAELAPAAVEVVCAQKSVILGRIIAAEPCTVSRLLPSLVTGL